MLESCSYNLEGLPDRKMFITCHNVVASINTCYFVFTVFIYNRSPPSRESSEYRGIVIAQLIFLFSSMLLWSSSFKFYADFGVNTGQAYSISCLLFGLYGSFVIISYIYRLYIISHPNHTIRKPHMITILSSITIILGSVLSTLTFYLAYVSDISNANHPLKKLTMRDSDWLIKKGVVWYPFTSLKGIIYAIYFGFLLLALAIVAIVFCLEIGRQIYIKQIISSNATKKYHIHVLKSLIIQTTLTVTVIVLAPFMIALRLISGLSPCLVEISFVFMGVSFAVHTTVLLIFNKNLSLTVLRVFNLEKTKLETITARSSKVPQMVVSRGS